MASVSSTAVSAFPLGNFKFSDSNGAGIAGNGISLRSQLPRIICLGDRQPQDFLPENVFVVCLLPFVHNARVNPAQHTPQAFTRLPLAPDEPQLEIYLLRSLEIPVTENFP